ncbi:YqzL family protein [Paenibacillus radicis (ex Xue et al. 2023)]|uniref:YqzL family protein n=1 Tax=Paenibacillus radicis (ex Xue et al. 2023) TaxID=2972489 RepID=A0ABT1YE03_9BACL|nr:YqzL family protein [Paenibacillus radicis (ex Xue et al. 2023)]MCR8631417.1 YqzL family protein [Paenibacillus radicis (ex Xue et al. 2023)]
MRDFSWKYFSITGDVDAYLLYKEISDPTSDDDAEEENDQEDLLQ